MTARCSAPSIRTPTPSLQRHEDGLAALQWKGRRYPEARFPSVAAGDQGKRREDALGLGLLERDAIRLNRRGHRSVDPDHLSAGAGNRPHPDGEFESGQAAKARL